MAMRRPLPTWLQGLCLVLLTWLQGLCLVLLALVAFGSALPNQWIWDDNDYVTENPVLTEEGGLERIWFEPSSLPQYYPLVHTTFWLERRLWGDDESGGPNAFGFHLDNVLLHGLGAVMLWLLLLRLGMPGAWLMAAIWAVHPVNVESVAWVTERKNVLSLFLALASIHQSLRYALEKKPLALLWAVLLFAGALASKTVVASAPAVTMLLLWWKRHPFTKAEMLRVVLPLSVMLLLGGIAGWWTAVLEVEHVGAEGQAWDHSFVERCLIAGRILWSYLGTLVWPLGLLFIYPLWEIDSGDPTQWIFPVAALALVAFLIAMLRRWGRGPLVAVLIFGGVLFPALGFLNVYPHQFSFVADHFQYHAAIAMVVLISRVLFWTRDGRPRAELTQFGAPALIVVLGFLSFKQGFIYENEEVLWLDTVERNPEASIGFNNLGLMAYQDSQGLLRSAQQPGLPEATVRQLQQQAVEKREEAIDLLESAVETGPYHPQAMNNLGQLLLHFREPSAAMNQRIEGMLTRSAELAPEYVKPRVNLGDLYRRMNRIDDAIRVYREANQLNSAASKRLQGSGVDGRVPQVSLTLGELLMLRDQPVEAIDNLRYSAQAGATAVQSAVMLVWIYSTHPESTVRDANQALYWCEQLRKTEAGSDPRVLDACAAAFANAGQYQQAVQILTDAIFGVMQQGQDQLAGQMRQRLELYKKNQPLRNRYGLPR